MKIPASVADVQLLIDSQIPESVHLDYKRSEALTKGKPDAIKAELAKDVSAFANSDGGILIYGVAEEALFPHHIDQGVDDETWSVERLESVINSRITPRIDGVAIHRLPLDSGRSIFVLGIPRSNKAPHQEMYGHRYYRRVGTQSIPLEDFEIRDLRNRFVERVPLVSLDVDVRDGFWLDLTVRNIGPALARNLSFILVPEVSEVTKTAPNWVTRGLRFLYPGKEYRMTIGTVHEPLDEGNSNHPALFDVTVAYEDSRTAMVVTDTFHVDLSALLNTPLIYSESHRLGETMKASLEKLTKEVASLRSAVADLATIAGGTGIDLSFTTLQNLARIQKGEVGFEQIDPTTCEPAGFREVLGVPYPVAHALSSFFRHRRQFPGKLEGIHGVTPEVLSKLRMHFRVDDES